MAAAASPVAAVPAATNGAAAAASPVTADGALSKDAKVKAYLKRIRFYDAIAYPDVIKAGVSAAEVKVDAAKVRADYVPDADAHTLDVICRCHALSVPFENLNVHRGVKYDLNVNALYDKVVTRHHGGFCFELNGLLGWLLEALGYRVSYCIAQINRSPGIDGYAAWSPYTHLILVVKLPAHAPQYKLKAAAAAAADGKTLANGGNSDGLGYENEPDADHMWACDVGQGWHPGGAVPFRLNTPYAAPDEWAYLVTRSGQSPFFFPPKADSAEAKQVAPPQSVLDRYARALVEDHKLAPGAAAAPGATSAAPLFGGGAAPAATAAAAAANGAPNTHALNNPIAAPPPPPNPNLPPAPKYAEAEMRPRFTSDKVWYVLHRYSPALKQWIPRVQWPWFTSPLAFPDDSVDPMNIRVLHGTSPFYRDVAATTLNTTRMLTVAGLKLITTKLPYGPKSDRPLKDAAEAIAILKAEHQLDVDSDAERARGVLRFGGWPFQHNSTAPAANRPPGTVYHVHNGSVCELTTDAAGAVTSGAGATASVGIAAAAPIAAAKS